MTRDQAISLVIGVATAWGENAEEEFPRRLKATDSDDDLQALLVGEDYEHGYTLDRAQEIRDLWIAIDILNSR